MMTKYNPYNEDLDDFSKAFNQGLELAARQAEDWAKECVGDSGKGYLNLAEAIRNRQRA